MTKFSNSVCFHIISETLIIQTNAFLCAIFTNISVQNVYWIIRLGKYLKHCIFTAHVNFKIFINSAMENVYVKIKWGTVNCHFQYFIGLGAIYISTLLILFFCFSNYFISLFNKKFNLQTKIYRNSTCLYIHPHIHTPEHDAYNTFTKCIRQKNNITLLILHCIIVLYGTI